MKLTDFRLLSFDCYGTLIDWESGLLAALGPLFEHCAEPPGRGAALAAFAEAETAAEETTPGALYPEILADVHRRLAAGWGAEVPEAMHRAFAASVAAWPAFADSAAALEYLGRHYRLVILSNVDRQSFAGSRRRLGVEFDGVYTAEEIGSYKPSRRNFEYLLEHVRQDFGLGPEDVLHTAQSLFHDHVPAQAIGLATAWIDRRHGAGGSGATKEPAERPRPDFRFTSMAAMARAHREVLASG